MASCNFFLTFQGETMMNRKKSFLFNRPRFIYASGLAFALALFIPSLAIASSNSSDISITIELLNKKSVFLTQHGGPPEGRGPRHGGRGRHCLEMGHEKNCPGGKGMRHRGGMEMHQGKGSSGSAQCPPDQIHEKGS